MYHAAARDSGDAASKNSNVIFPVHLAEADADPFLVRGRQVFADVVRADGELAVAAVDEDRQLHGGGATDVHERVERGADGAAGEEHVVDEHDEQDLHVRRHVGWLEPWHSGKYRASLEVVRDNIASRGEIAVCEFVPGYVEDTLHAPELPERVALAFTDVDTPGAVRTCLTRIWPRIAPGGVYASHDVALLKSLQVLLSDIHWD